MRRKKEKFLQYLKKSELEQQQKKRDINESEREKITLQFNDGA